MMRRSSRKYNPSAIEQAGQRHWNEVHGFYRDQARRWAFVAACSVIVAGIAVTRGWYYDTKPQRVPYIIDRNGPSLQTAMLQASMPDAARIRGHLTTWVMGFQTVTADANTRNAFLQKHLAEQTYNWTDKDSIAVQQLDDWYIANRPSVRAQTTTVDVNVTSVIPQAGDGWLVDWTLTTYSRDVGKLPVTSYWRMSVVVHIHLPETDEDFNTNWDGVYVQSFHIIAMPSPQAPRS